MVSIGELDSSGSGSLTHARNLVCRIRTNTYLTFGILLQYKATFAGVDLSPFLTVVCGHIISIPIAERARRTIIPFGKCHFLNIQLVAVAVNSL